MIVVCDILSSPIHKHATISTPTTKRKQNIYPNISKHLRSDASPKNPHIITLLRPHILLILIRRPHPLHNLLSLLLAHTPLLRDNRAHHIIDLTRHVRRVAADVQVRLLLEQLVDLVRALLQPVLNVDFVGAVAGEGGDELEGVAEFGAPLLL